MIERFRSHLLEEWHRILRFCLIGGLSFGLYFIFYAALSRWLWTAGNRTLENVLANVLAAVFNFFAHRYWTFRAHAAHAAQVPRYLFVLISSFVLQSFLFWLGLERFHLNDFLVAILVGAAIPFYTYLMHRFFTFRASARPESIARN